MTIEEKAKAYDEALERAKSWAEGKEEDLGASAKSVAEFIFPELRESEDEIHRKWILGYLYDGLRKADEQFKDHFKSAIDWLEKQKETSHISEMCKENANSFADGIIEVRSFQRGMEEGRKLEKQKEQKQDEGDFTIYHPQKNGKGKYECIPFSFYGSLTSFSNNRDLMAFLNESFYDKEECERWCEWSLSKW